MSAPLPLEPDSGKRLRLGEKAVGYLDSFIAGRAAAPAYGEIPDGLVLEWLRQPPREDGVSLDVLLEKIDVASQSGIDTATGAHLSYIPNGGLYTAALGELIAAGINRYTGGSHGAPGAISIEQGVVDWILGLFELGENAAGILLSGGSLANFTAMVAARARLGDGFAHGVVYTSVRAHHSVAKAARLVGVGAANIRAIATDESLRLDVEALRQAINTDEASGLQPMAIVASAGTTDTGTIDPLPATAAVAAEHGAWFHVDAAYGGFFQLTARGAERLRGIDLADSITLDAHKSLFMPYGVGCLLVRDRGSLVAAHEGRGAYMQEVRDLEEIPNYFALGPELTRPFRGLPVWLALHMHGVGAFRDELDLMLDLAARAQRELDDIERVETVTVPDLSVVSFRSSRGNEDSMRLFEHLNGSLRVHVSSTTIGGEFVLRLAFLNHRTSHETLDTVLELLHAAPD